MLFHEVHGMLCLLSLFYGFTDLKILILARSLADEFAQFGFTATPLGCTCVSKGTIWITSLIPPHEVVTNLASHSVVVCKQQPLYHITYKIYINQYYASITIVQNYTGNITTLLFQVRSMSNSAGGKNKQYFSGIRV